jgi:hypothetical protein
MTQNWRLVSHGNGQILVPPGLVRTDTTRRTFKANVTPGLGQCSSSAAVVVHPRGRHLITTVSQPILATQSPGWLREWTDALEFQGCIATGEGPILAEQILESVPLDPRIAFGLLHANLVDIVPGTRIQVISPLTRNGNGAISLGSGSGVVGHETDLYDVRSKTGASGVTIAAVSAEQRLQDRTEQLTGPTTNYFQFSSTATFYRLLYKDSETGFTALVVAAHTYADLEQRVKGLDGGVASCERVGSEWCMAIPKLVALNIVVPATVNGVNTFVRYGATLAEAIRAAGERHPEEILPRLTVLRIYGVRQVPVQFDHASAAILALPLAGGEIVSWK